MNRPTAYDVAIIGCGPVGATLANMLGLFGLRVCVLEKESTPYSLPRAGHFDDEVMRVWQTLGLSSEVVTETRVNPGMRFVDARGNLILNWPRPMEVGPQGWHASYRFHQPTLEMVLRGGLSRFPDSCLLLGHEVTGVTQNADHAEIAFAAPGGETGTIRAKYVVGCDGGRSLVRKTIGSDMVDLGTHEDWLVIDVILKRNRDDLGDYTIQYCDPARPTTYARCVGERRRWEIMVLPEDDVETIAQPDTVWKLLAPWITPDDAELERSTVYTFHGMVAERWRDRRLLLAGDAAHMTPPFMGQGMCAGVRDTANLAWKLAAVLNGGAADDLLDSYQEERDPHVREFVQMAIDLGSIIQTRDPEVARQRDEQLARDPKMLVSIKPRLGSSALNDCQGAVGNVSEQIVLGDGRKFDDVVGARFALLLRSDFSGDIPASLLETASAAGMFVVAGEGEDYLARLGVAGLVIRPDRYILGEVHGIADLEAAVEQIRALSPQAIPA